MTVLKCSVEYYKNLETCLKLLCKRYKEKEKTEKNKRKKKKKEKGEVGRAASPAQHQIDPHGPPGKLPNGYPEPFFSLTGGAHLSDASLTSISLSLEPPQREPSPPHPSPDA
jgi:hypothetical protein